MAERRRSKRQKSFLRGSICFANRHGAMPCMIRDLSEQGAHIIFSEAVSLPEKIELHIPQKGKAFEARVQWRHGDELGLAFTTADAAPAKSLPEDVLVDRIAQLESEIAALRRVIHELRRELPGSDEAA